LVNLRPDVLFAITALSAVALRQYTFTIPTIFVQVGDPVAFGLVTNLARPDGNITGFTSFNYAIGGKWIETLKDTVPGLTWAAIFFEAGNPSSTQYITAIEAAAAKLNVRLIPVPVQSVSDINSAFAAFADVASGAVIVVPVGTVILHRKEIIALAAQHRLPGMYPYRFFAAEGGLMSYGSDVGEQYRNAASYIDRILRGAKPKSPWRGCTLGVPFLALLTCRRPVLSSTCDHCRSHSSTARRPCRYPIRIIVASRWPHRLPFRAAVIRRSTSRSVRYFRTGEFTVVGTADFPIDNPSQMAPIEHLTRG
jgi:ABC transporter substrate binding protein